MNSRDITLYLDERWYAALSKHLKGETLEEHLEGVLDEMCNQLPQTEYERISQEIWQEEQHNKAEAESGRRFSIARITENGESRCLLLERGEIMFQTALRLRRHLRGELQDPAQFYRDGVPITQEEMELYTAEMLCGSPRVVGIYDIDLDTGEVYSLDADNGWLGYRIKDVSTAAYFATRRESDDWIAKRSRFYERLNAIELSCNFRPAYVRGSELIPATGFTFSKAMGERHGVIYGYILADFDKDKVFGLHVEGEGNPSYANLHFSYDLREGYITDSLGISLWKGETMLQCKYRLSPKEQERLCAGLDTHFRATMGLGLEEYRTQYLAEEQNPADQEPPQQTGHTFQM